MKRIAPCTGGGIRGTLIACMLVELEKQAGMSSNQIFDFIAGTSTGALIAAAVAVGLPATQILEIYQKRTAEIFNHGILTTTPLEFARGYAFDPENIRRVLVEEFGPAAKVTMNQCPIKVLITAVGMNGHPWYFVPKSNKNSGLTGDVSLVDAAVASAAAPFYFDHAKVTVGNKVVRLFDGGAGGLANPTYQAAIEAFKFDDYNAIGTKIITFGTGYYPADDVAPDGALEVIGWVIDTLIDNSEDAVDQATEEKWPFITTKINWPLPRPIDMASVADIPDLVALGQREAAKINWLKLLEL